MSRIFKTVLCKFSGSYKIFKVQYVRKAPALGYNTYAQNKLENKRCFSVEVQQSNDPSAAQNGIYVNVETNQHQDNIEKKYCQEDGRSLLDPYSEDLSHVAPYFPPTFNFASYINKSKTLQEFVKLGVDLHIWEKKKGIPQFVLKLDFESNIKAHLTFLHDVGVPSSSLGNYLTKNPLIFKEAIDDLHVRVNYLLSKKFTPLSVSRIVNVNPHWLMFSTERIDRRLGYFQKNFELTGDQVRELTAKQPRLITFNMSRLNLNTFAIKEELGFNKNEVQKLLLKRPRLWMMDQNILRDRFNFVHTEMKIPHELICVQPQVLGSREFRTKQRHMFLAFLGRAQYNPKIEGYVSLRSLVSGNDAEFCLNVAKSSIHAFNLFLKTL